MSWVPALGAAAWSAITSVGAASATGAAAATGAATSAATMLQLASLGVGLTATAVSGIQQRQALAYNAKLAKQRAELASQQGARAAEAAQEQGERAIGTAAAAAGASGLNLGGSAADVLGDLAGQQRYNTTALIYQGNTERAAALSEAAIMKQQRTQAGWNTVLSMGGSILYGPGRGGWGGTGGRG